MQGATDGRQIAEFGSDRFNPRPLCRERRTASSNATQALQFQSTPPMQGATKEAREELEKMRVSIHAPYAGSDEIDSHSPSKETMFQSTPPMQGATMAAGREGNALSGFQSTPPMQGATTAETPEEPVTTVSIHAPYAGSDGVRCTE